jgi:hypothetical protein
MADSYGTHIFSISEDCNFNSIEGLRDELNRFHWCSSPGEWLVENDRIWFSKEGVQYPVVWPGILKVDHDEDEDDESEGEIDFSLSDFAKIFSTFINSGSFTISMVENMKQRSLTFAKLTIYSNGAADYGSETRSIWNDLATYSETYTPEGEEK